MNEQTPLLQKQDTQACCPIKNNNKGAETACCSLKKKNKQPICNELPPANHQDYCFLADQKWEYKCIALMCAIFLAGNLSHLLEISMYILTSILVGSHFAAHTLGAMKNTIKTVNALRSIIQVSFFLISWCIYRNLVSPILNMVLFNPV
jgi:hypothetical protein